jgi:hypothetical protein
MSGRLGIKLCVWSQVLCEFPVSGYSLAVIVPAFSQPAGVPQEKAFLKDFNRVFPPVRLSVREGKNLFSQLSAVFGLHSLVLFIIQSKFTSFVLYEYCSSLLFTTLS